MKVQQNQCCLVADVAVYIYHSETHLCIFFFSSRRRHTRWTGDWSSDVCSSDLAGEGQGFEDNPNDENAADTGSARSEERRVGKECRSRGAADHQKKKDMLQESPIHPRLSHSPSLMWIEPSHALTTLYPTDTATI